MRYRPVLALVLLSATVVSAQQPAQPGTAAAIAEASIRGHMEFLAGDALNGRGSGTRDEWLAAEYVASQLRQWGIEPLGDGFGAARGYVQRVELRTVETTAPPVLSAGALRITHGKEMLVQSLGSIARVSGPLVKYAPGKA
ncbi:MAG: hypothetical protein M3R55_05475, partial [Acidobacteriota bacterium]|nr:hypothetical protein [Acidobacteriota bacterium]